MKKYPEFRIGNLTIKEVPKFKDKEQYALCEWENFNAIIKIKSNIPDWKKALAVLHELTHLIQFQEQEIKQKYTKTEIKQIIKEYLESKEGKDLIKAIKNV